jgi:hypothetical protein
MTAMVDRAAAWDDLTSGTTSAGVFDSATLEVLPDPARRFLASSVKHGVDLVPIVVLEMEGEIRLKDWTGFHGRQVLRAGDGFVWEAVAGNPLLSVRGGDSYWQGRGALDFKLWGVIPIVRNSGPEVDKSAAGRLAGETVVWVPQALTPQMGVSWTPFDADSATVAVPVPEGVVDVTVSVDQRGHPSRITMERWGDPGQEPYGLYPFGGDLEEHADIGDVTIATAGRVGWFWGTDRQQAGEFFRFRITDARVGPALR